MIQSKEDLHEWIKYEKSLYELTIFDVITRDEMYYSWKYVRLLRFCEYYRNRGKWYMMPLFLITRLRKNLLGMRIGVRIGENKVDKGLLICHNGSIIVDGVDLEIGRNLTLHGSNCIGNNGKNFDSPQIGNDVELGVGAIIVGGVTVGNHVVIAANSTVIRDCKEDNVVLAGSPAQVKKHCIIDTDSECK